MDRRGPWIALVFVVLVGAGFAATGLSSALIRSASAPATPTLAPGATAIPTLPPLVEPGVLHGLFGRVSSRVSSGGRLTLRTERVAELVLPSGRISAADAFIVDSMPFTTVLRPGRYPVELLIARYDGGDERVAAARVVVGPDPAERWELARTAANATETLAPGQVFGYGVDSGTGSFLSPEAASAAGGDPGYTDRLASALAGHEVETWAWGVVVADPSSGANVVAFASGFGDGAYATFVGLAADGSPAVLMTDFALVDEP